MNRFVLLLAVGLMCTAGINTSYARDLSREQNHQMPTSNGRSILCSQIPDTLSASGYACQLDSVNGFDADLADDILPGGTGWLIDSVVAWFCNWGYFHTWDSVPNIHFIIYRDSTGQPSDSPSAEIVVQQSEYVAYMITYPGQWRVEFGLTPPVFLDTFPYWIEIQPSNNTATNGCTGNMAQAGIGNGQDFFFRYPAVNILTWQDAYQVFGEHLETGFILIGTQLGVMEHSNDATGAQVLVISPTISRDTYAISLKSVLPRHVCIYLFNEAGQKIRTIIDNQVIKGSYCSDFSLRGLSAGVYFIVVDMDDGSVARKITKIR